MVLRFASSLFGMVRVSTPSLYSAEVLSSSTAGQREASGEGAVRPLDAVVVLLLHLFFQFAFTLKEKRIVFDADVQVFRVYAWQLHLHNDVVTGFIDIDGRRPPG